MRSYTHLWLQLTITAFHKWESLDTMFNNHLMKVCLAAVFAIGLAACSSSSDQTAAPDPMPTEPMPEPTPEEQIATLQEQINALRAELGLDPIDIDDLTGSVSDLQGQVDDLEEEIEDRDEKIADADAMAMTAKGKAIFGVLDPLGDATTAADSAISPDATTPTVAASYGKPTGVTVANHASFVDGLAPSLTDITSGANAFTTGQAGDPAMLAANNGFSGTMLTWKSSTRADTMFVYTDIAAPSSTLFAEVYGGGTQELDPADTAHMGVKGAAFDGRTGGDVEHAPNAKLAATDAVNNLVRLSGSYQGAAGIYTCTPATGGTGCITRVSATGVTFVDGTATTGWMFTANNGAMVSVADNAYMKFGWWMRDDLTSADPLDSVAVFHGTEGGTAVTGVDDLTGTATYEGAAAGKYAWRDRVEDTAHGGHFTAKAMLTANFDIGVDGAAGSMMSGSISDFRLGDDGTDPNWTVTLSGATITNAGAVARAADTVMTTWAVGDNKADAAGGWQAQLSSTGAERNDNLPTGVSGAFNAEFGQMGRMLGAFGANITNANPPK